MWILENVGQYYSWARNYSAAQCLAKSQFPGWSLNLHFKDRMKPVKLTRKLDKQTRHHTIDSYFLWKSDIKTKHRTILSLFSYYLKHTHICSDFLLWVWTPKFFLILNKKQLNTSPCGISIRQLSWKSFHNWLFLLKAHRWGSHRIVYFGNTQKAEMWDIADVISCREFWKEITMSSDILFKHDVET